MAHPPKSSANALVRIHSQATLILQTDISPTPFPHNSRYKGESPPQTFRLHVFCTFVQLPEFAPSRKLDVLIQPLVTQQFELGNALRPLSLSHNWLTATAKRKGGTMNRNL